MLSDSARFLQHPRFLACPWQGLSRPAREQVAAYLVVGATMRPYLRAIAAGDLFAATRLRVGLDIAAAADFFEHMPGQSHGSWTRVAEWEMIGGLKGIEHLTEGVNRVYP